jgi:hypothetical protein
MEQPGSCECAAWADRVRINLGFETADLLERRFDTLRERNAWIRVVRCQACGQAWYVGVDTVDDDLYFRRLSAAEEGRVLDRAEWPTDYDGFVNVWPMESGRDFMARLHWPWKGEAFESR